MATLLVIAILLAGCAGTPRNDCAASTCAPRSTSVELTPKIVQFEGCEGGLGLALVPMEKARAVVPHDFDISNAFGAPNTAGIHTRALKCSRVIINTTNFTDVSWFYTAVFVSPRDETWQGNGVNQYLLDSWFSTPELAEWFTSARIPAGAAVFGRESLPPGTAPRTEQWNVDGATCDIRVRFNVSGQTLPPYRDTFFFWVGPTPYQRLELFEAWVTDAHNVSGSPFQIEGQCTSEQALEGVSVHGTEYIPTFNATLTITGKTFPW